MLANSMQYGIIRVESDIYDEEEEEAKTRNCPKYSITVHFPSYVSLKTKYTTSNQSETHSWYLNELLDEYGAFDKKELRRAITELIKRKNQ